MRTEYRFMSDNELVNCLAKDCSIDMDQLNITTILNQLTPAKRKLAETVIELYKRSLHQVQNRNQIRSSRDIFKIMNPILSDLDIEEFWFIGISQGGKVIDKARLSIGGIAGVYVDLRVLAKHLLNMGATQCAIIHNHPSGTKQPSAEDKNITDRIKKAMDLLNIRLIDHVIICHDNYYSFADEGMI